MGRPAFGLRPTVGVRPAGSTTSKGEDQRVTNVVNNALWGKKDGGARPRVIPAAIPPVVALSAPATVRAADVPASLLSQAQANPTQTFDVIVQTSDSSRSPMDATVGALATPSQQSFKDSVKNANDLAKKAADAARKIADAAKRAADAQQRAAD